MEKAKNFKEVELAITKIYFAAGEDWSSPVADGLPMGMYLGESVSGVCLFAVDEFGCKCGMWLPIGLVIKYNIDKQKADYATTLMEIEERLKKIESLACDNDVHLNEIEEKEEEQGTILQRVLESVDINLANIHERIDALQKREGNQKSTLAEMSDAVVNIIKATK
jgi:uncharacterized coiled-coil protein SlyX